MASDLCSVQKAIPFNDTHWQPGTLAGLGSNTFSVCFSLLQVPDGQPLHFCNYFVGFIVTPQLGLIELYVNMFFYLNLLVTWHLGFPGTERL